MVFIGPFVSRYLTGSTPRTATMRECLLQADQGLVDTDLQQTYGVVTAILQAPGLLILLGWPIGAHAMENPWLLVAVGGAVGAMLRYGVWRLSVAAFGLPGPSERRS